MRMIVPPTRLVVFPVLPLALVAGLACALPEASAAEISACAKCKTRATKRFVRAPAAFDCRAGTPTNQEERLRDALVACDQRFQCKGPTGPDAVVATLHALISTIETQICDPSCVGDACVPPPGDAIDPARIDGTVGSSEPAVDPAIAASFADVSEFCRTHDDYDRPPPLLALPTATELPVWCDEAQAYGDIVARCGALRTVVVAGGAQAVGADGTPAAPYGSISQAIAACGGPCHLLVAPGTYAESPSVPSCTIIEGGVRVEGGVLTSGAARPQLNGSIRTSGDAILLARLDVRHEYGALSVDGDVLVSDAVLRGGYEGGSAAWSATGPRLCRTNIAAGYGGFDIAWHSTRLWLAGSAVAACYEGMALSWGASDLRVVDSIVFGGYEAVGTSWGSTGVDVRGSRLGSDHAAVSIHIAPDDYDVFPVTFDVSVIGNQIASGTLPASDPALNIVVRDNVRE